MSDQPFAVGIDLGTTHCVLAFTPPGLPEADSASVRVLPIPQLLSPGIIEARPQLPSFLYLAHPAEFRPEDRVMPWDNRENPSILAGEVARSLGAKTPARLIASAKSWLSHGGVDRRAAILPVQAPDEVPRLSPVEVSKALLQHLSAAWSQAFPDAPLAEQSVVITVPASFDPGARDLTVEAARSLGLTAAVLLEEPQAAFYSWIQSSDGRWREEVRPGDTVLVVDVGGGTTDFSLIAVAEEAGELVLERVAIGDHILLGGDNMDLALAYRLRQKMEDQGQRLDPFQWQGLTHAAREAKEALFQDQQLSTHEIALASRGSALIGGVIRTQLTREELEAVVLDGFFPSLSAEERPLARPRSGLTTLALPYAQDARITAHLAAFLARHRSSGSDTDLRPTAVLLNGGVFRSEQIVCRLMDVLNSWLSLGAAEPVRLLAGVNLDLAVARGAAYYARVRHGQGVRIRGGTAAAYYVGVESAVPAVPGFVPPLEALCIAPFGLEEGTEVTLPAYEFGVVVGEPVHFRFFSSKVRRQDLVGTRLDPDGVDALEELTQIEVELSSDRHQRGEIVPVFLAARVTEVGTLALEAVARDGSQRWRVEFDVRTRDDR